MTSPIVVFPVMWSSDIKSNITNELSDPENLYSDIYLDFLC